MFFARQHSSFDAERRRLTQIVFENVQSVDVNLSLQYIKPLSVISILDLQIFIEYALCKKYIESRYVISMAIIITAFVTSCLIFPELWNYKKNQWLTR